MIAAEVATVYRGGGRRWFSLGAAINAEAKAAYKKIVKSSGRCECGSQFIDGFGDIDDYCRYHDMGAPIYGRYIRFAKHCISRNSP